MRFFPREKGKNGLCRGSFFEKAVFPFSRGENRISQGVENRGSLISAPLAFREIKNSKSKIKNQQQTSKRNYCGENSVLKETERNKQTQTNKTTEQNKTNQEAQNKNNTQNPLQQTQRTTQKQTKQQNKN